LGSYKALKIPPLKIEEWNPRLSKRTSPQINQLSPKNSTKKNQSQLNFKKFIRLWFIGLQRKRTSCKKYFKKMAINQTKDIECDSSAKLNSIQSWQIGLTANSREIFIRHHTILI
jgi:hypothetical protein